MRTDTTLSIKVASRTVMGASATSAEAADTGPWITLERMYPLHSTAVSLVAKKKKEDIIPVSSTKYDKLYPQYEKALSEGAIPAGTTFQQWLRQRRRKRPSRSKGGEH